MARALYPRNRNGRIWRFGEENSPFPSGIWNPDRPERSLHTTPTDPSIPAPVTRPRCNNSTQFAVISTWRILERHQKHRYWVQMLRQVLSGSKIRQFFVTKCMHHYNLYLPYRRSLLCESHTVSMVTTEHCFWVTSQLFNDREYRYVQYHSRLMKQQLILSVYEFFPAMLFE
jgi:hypothetical protein